MISLKGTFFDLRPKSNSRRVLLVARSDKLLLEGWQQWVEAAHSDAIEISILGHSVNHLRPLRATGKP
jgi:hypothetical protein